MAENALRDMTREEKAAFVAEKTLWRGELSQAEALVVADLLTVRRGKAGDYLFREGDLEDYLAFVVEGQFQIIKKNQYLRKKIVAEFQAGDILGEISLIDDQGRSASAYAVSDYCILVLSREDYLALTETNMELGYKLLHTICRLICDRLRETTGVAVYANFTECALPGADSPPPHRQSWLKRILRQ